MPPELHYETNGGEQRYRWGAIAMQGEVWVDGLGREHRIADMDPDYRRNAAAWFIRYHASRLHDRMVMGALAALASGVGALSDAPDGAFAELDKILDATPEEWAETTPLIRALRGAADAA